jgi:uncharacterized protein (TIGR03437 family)
MTARPSIPQWATSGFWYAFGVDVHPSRGDADWDHSGSVDGTTTQFFRTSDGLVLVVCFNYRPSSAAEERALGVDLSIGLIDAASRVADWPQNDLFIDYPDTDPTAAASLPAVTTRESVVSAATFNRGIVAGSWLTLSGANLASATRSWTASEIVDGGLPISMDDVGITIAGKPAYLSYISPTQINAQAPEGLTPGWAPVEVVRGGVSSGPVLALVVPNAPGAFTYMVGGQTFAIATRADGRLLGESAAPGETIVIYSTGLTASPAGRIIPEPQDVSGVELTIGGRSAPVMSATLVSPGLFQISAIVPDVEDGSQPLVVRTNGAISPSGVLVPIHH